MAEIHQWKCHDKEGDEHMESRICLDAAAEIVRAKEGSPSIPPRGGDFIGSPRLEAKVGSLRIRHAETTTLQEILGMPEPAEAFAF